MIATAEQPATLSRIDTRSAPRATGGLSCSNCHLRGACLPRNSPSTFVSDISGLIKVRRRVPRGGELYGRGEPFNALYAIHSGSFKSVAVTRVGHKKVTGLHLPADLVGLEAISGRVHEHEAVALEASEVCVVPYDDLLRLTSWVPELQTHLLTALSAEISRDNGLLLRLGSMSADERVAAFVLGLSARYERLGHTGMLFRAHLNRMEIASFLGLSSETVTRVFSRLQHAGLIETKANELRITNVNGLHTLSGT